MTDRREAILSRLEEILGGLDGGWQAFRNKEDLTPRMYPCFVLFDGHEDRIDSGERIGMRTQGIGLVKMTPRIGIYLSEDPETVGPDLNAMRISVLKAVLTDAALLDSLTFNGDMFYEGAGTALDRGMEMTGEMLLSISFTYMLNPFEF
jgi:hypothetical protein